jgi:hypothetical protein
MIRTLKVSGLLAVTSILRGSFGVVILTILILALVSMNLLFVPGLLNGLVWGANEKLVDTYVGNLIIEPSSQKELIRDSDDLVSRIEAI